MYHITRCPNCRTSFRVTDAHLAAFDGKVRCGRCAFVFDATEHLVGDAASRPAPAPAPAPQVTPPPAARVTETAVAATVATPPAPTRQAEHEENLYGLDSMASQLEAAAEAERDQADDTLASQSLAQLANALAQPPVASPAPGSDMLELDLDEIHQRLEHAPASPAPAPLASEIEVIEIPPVAGHEDFATEPFEHWPEHAAQAEAPAAPVVAALAGDAPAEETMLELSLPTEPVEAAPEVETVAARAVAEAGTGSYRPIMTAQDEAMLRVPERPSPWRWLWSIPALLAFLGLVGQLTYHYRTEIAIQLPGIEPKLQRFCAMTGCELELPARAGYLRTEWNELVSLPEHPNLIQLNATLRNQAGFTQALPLLELTLTDDTDRIVARKVFSAREYLAPLADGTPAPLPESLAANGDLRVFLQLDLGEMHSSGYSLNWFYPEPN
ncbi:DUF3426 domain-containing protein [Chitinimonas sp.]|uniref:DUF3426 domain-containing protein n=1 Tax=Chitinimonas sp. TaxID=1934313 RepID=UPI002F94E0ED